MMNSSVKKVVIAAFGLMVLWGAAGLWAQERSHGRKVDQIVKEIEQKQGVETISGIDPNQVSPKMLEELGDSVMDLMIADEQQHSWMDDMMGGEGSEQLSSMHRWIGYNYIVNNGNLGAMGWGPGSMGPGMGPGMMRPWNGYSERWNGASWGPGMMGEPYGARDRSMSAGSWIWIVGAVIVVGLVLLVVFLLRGTGGGKSQSAQALDILKSRFARGEISEEEFEKMRERLR